MLRAVDCLIVSGARIHWRAVNKWWTRKHQRLLFYTFQKSPQRHMIWKYFQQGRCFWKWCSASWPFWGEPRTGNTMSTAAMCNVLLRTLSHLQWIVLCLPCDSTLYTVWVTESCFKQALKDPEGRVYQTSRQSTHVVAKFVSSMHRLPLHPRKYSWYLLILGYAVAQLVEALRYKPEGGGFDPR